MRYAFPKRKITEIEEASNLGQNLSLLIPPYSQRGQEALLFAREKLKEHAGITPFQFRAGLDQTTHEPVNQEISSLTALYWEVYFKAFEEAVKKNQQNPWSQPEVIDAADACMKISFAISCLTLDDLPAFTQRLASQNEPRTYAEALTRQDSYQYRTFYYCANAYHWARGGIVWGLNLWSLHACLTYPDPETLSDAFVQSFYDHKNRTIQNTWNALYNEYCDRIRQYVTEEKLGASYHNGGDGRHVNWTQKDLGVKTFNQTPDTQPT